MDDLEQDDPTTEPETESDFDPAEHVLADFEASKTYFADWHEKIEEEVEMALDLVQHETDLGHEKNQNFAQVKDLSLLSALRRKWSQTSAAPVYINAFPQDDLADPYSAERTRWALEREVYSAKRMFKRKRKRAIMGAMVGREWYLTFGWNPKLGEITYSNLPPTDAFRCPGFPDIHDPECPWLILRFRLPISQIRERARMYGQLDEDAILDIGADTGSQADSKPSGPLPGMVRLDRSNPEGAPAGPREKTAVLLVAMYREDPERAEIEELLGEQPVEPYMRCFSCGYETADHPVGDDGALPEVGDVCPQCKAREGVESLMAPPLERVEKDEFFRTHARFPNGRWIEVLEEERTTIYDGDWPYQKPSGGTLRSFPSGQYRIYDDPRHEIPHSDVSWQWNQALMATFMLQWAVDQVRTSGRVIIIPRGALQDSRGRPFVPNNRIDSIAWVKDPMLAKSIQEFQPRGLPEGWANLYGALVNTFRANLGTGELGLGPEQSKNLPVGTAHAIIESGDIPVDDALANIRDEDGHVLGVVADMIQCCWSESKWVRHLGEDGKVAYEYFSGADLCDVDVVITGDPSFDVIQSAKLERMKLWFGMSPPEQRLAAQMLNLDPTRVAQFQQEMAAFAAAMPLAGGGPGTTGQGGVGPRPSPPSRRIAPQRSTAGLEALSPELQAGLAGLIQ